MLVTTLTKRMAEDLTAYLTKAGVKVRYMHHDVETIERMELIRGLRLGEFDVLVGINLLREGLDMPEVSLVAILDADKEGFLRSETSLIQTIGRAARNADGLVILYADTVTRSMRSAMDETLSVRAISSSSSLLVSFLPDFRWLSVSGALSSRLSRTDLMTVLGTMPWALLKSSWSFRRRSVSSMAERMEFEYAAVLRDRLIELRKDVR